jgi:hypothetical protein
MSGTPDFLVMRETVMIRLCAIGAKLALVLPSASGLFDRNNILAAEPTRSVQAGAHFAGPGQPILFTDTKPTKEGFVVFLFIIRLWSTAYQWNFSLMEFLPY